MRLPTRVASTSILILGIEIGQSTSEGGNISLSHKEGRTRNMSVMPAQMPAWKEQWERVLRWYARFEKTNAGRSHDMDSDFYQDEVYSFFQNSHHLKDWLKNDPTVSGIGDVEKFIEATSCPRTGADLANGSKHLVIKRHIRDDANTRIGRRDFEVDLGSPPVIRAKYAVEALGVEHDAFTLGTAYLDAWKTYLRGKGLLS